MKIALVFWPPNQCSVNNMACTVIRHLTDVTLTVPVNVKKECSTLPVVLLRASYTMCLL